MVSNDAEVDEIDRKIIQIIQEEPNITHTEIANRIERSQPTVGLRIKKLEELGVLDFQAGINMKGAEDFYFGRVELHTNQPNKLLNTVEYCPLILNGFRISGKNNVSLLLSSIKLNHLENLVNFFFRDNLEVSNLEFTIITEVVEDFVLPMDLDLEMCDCDMVDECKKVFEENNMIKA
jgi:DNA-binding Lrp family transcriptional regulator